MFSNSGMMPHWLTVTLRCWIAFIALTNFGAAFRCFTDDNFVHSKLFGVESWKSMNQNFKEAPILERMYGFWSLLNGVVLLICFFFIEEKKILGLSVCVLVLYLSFFVLEAYCYKTIIVHGPTVYPCALSGLTLCWLFAGLKYLCSPVQCKEDLDENEILRKQFSFRSVSKKMR